MTFDAATEAAITTPGPYERGTDRLVWLVWEVTEDVDYTGVPSLNCICTSEHSVRYHLGCLLEQAAQLDPRGGPWRQGDRWLAQAAEASRRRRWHVERAPTDHAFGSVMLQQAQREREFTPPIRIAPTPRLGAPGYYKHNGD